MDSIIIHKPSLSDENARVVLRFPISISNGSAEKKSAELWFSFDPKYRDHICYEVCDSAVIPMLQYCLKGGYNIESEIPMTDRLYYSIVNQYLPQMLATNPTTHPFKISVKTVCPDWKPTAVATAMSCGIDSLTTYYECTDGSLPENFRLTHLTFYEQGAHHGGGHFNWEEQDKLFSEQYDRVKSFCDAVNVELIGVRSNIDEFLSDVFWKERYENAHTYRNTAITLLMQKLIRVYYYSASYNNLDRFDFSLDSDPAHYEKWLLAVLSTSYTSFFSASSSMRRIEKIKFLSEKPETYDHVLVCFMGGKNCGVCKKCWRTMLEMEICGVLDLYRGSFDVDGFRKYKDHFIARMLMMRKDEPLMQEIADYMKANGVEIPRKCRREAQLLRINKKLKNSTLYSSLSGKKRKKENQG